MMKSAGVSSEAKLRLTFDTVHFLHGNSSPYSDGWGVASYSATRVRIVSNLVRFDTFFFGRIRRFRAIFFLKCQVKIVSYVIPKKNLGHFFRLLFKTVFYFRKSNF